MSPTEAAHHASVYSESSVPSVLLCFCALSSPFLTPSLSSASWAGQVLQMPLNFSLSFSLCNTPTQCLWHFLLLEPTIFTYPPENRAKWYLFRKGLMSYQIIILPFAQAAWGASQHTGTVCVCVHTSGTGSGRHRERLVYKGHHIVTV